MKGVLVEDWTDFEQLTLRDDVPTPAVGERQVKIAIKAAGVSFATTLVVSGRYQRKPPLPFVPGTEVAGVISEVGPGVSRFQVGDRVCAALDWGGMAEEAVTLDATVFPIPNSMPFEQAIGLTNSYGTSYAGLFWPHLLNVQAGQTLLVHGAAGGVGLAAVEMGKIQGAKVIATVSSEAKRELVLARGADHAINYTTDRFRDAVKDFTDGIGADAIYDPVGGDVFDQSLRCIAPEGRILPVGFAGGRIPQIPANILLVKNVTVCGLNMGYYFGWSPTDMRYEYTERLQHMIARLAGWFTEGKISLTTSDTFPLGDFQLAMKTVVERRAMGRVALVMEGKAVLEG